MNKRKDNTNSFGRSKRIRENGCVRIIDLAEAMLLKLDSVIKFIDINGFSIRPGALYETALKAYFENRTIRSHFLKPVIVTLPSGHFKGNAHILLPSPLICKWFKSIEAMDYKKKSNIIAFDILQFSQSDLKMFGNIHMHPIDVEDLTEHRAENQLTIQSLRYLIRRIHYPTHEFCLKVSMSIYALNAEKRVICIDNEWLGENWI